MNNRDDDAIYAEALEKHTIVFESSTRAWAFVRACDVLGVAAGYPSLRAPYGRPRGARAVCVMFPSARTEEVYQRAMGGERLGWRTVLAAARAMRAANVIEGMGL